MAIKLEIPTALRPFTGKQASVEFKAATVGEALKRLTATYADLRKHLYTDDGRIRSFVNIYVNDEDIRYLEKENTPIKDGDTISIVPSIAGGARGTRRQADTEGDCIMPIITGTPAAAEAARTLSKEEIQRYSRHLIMPEVGMEGQLKLANAKVLMIGAGGLGAPLGLYLAAAGVGRLGIVDFDVVDFTNLQRQITFSTADVGRPRRSRQGAPGRPESD